MKWISVFILTTIYNKHDDDKIGDQTRKNSQVLPQVLE